jgi:Ser/Thr protein kinase RdoA (MazF antagonist)
VRGCVECGRELEDDFRFCPGCGAAQRRKLVEYFRGDRRLDDGWLRASAYLVEPRHVRLSIWRNDRAEAVLSLDPAEAERLRRFLRESTSPPRPEEAARLTRVARVLRDALGGR